jgi:hypothetical protein
MKKDHFLFIPHPSSFIPFLHPPVMVVELLAV